MSSDEGQYGQGGQDQNRPEPPPPTDPSYSNPWNLPAENPWSESNQSPPPLPMQPGPNRGVGTGLWALVLIIFAALIGLTIQQTFAEDAADGRVVSYFQDEQMPDFARTRADAESKAEKREQILDDLYLKPINDPGVAQSILVMETESGLELSPDAIAELKSSRDSVSRTLAGLYEDPPESLEELEERFGVEPESRLQEIAYMQIREGLGDTEIRSATLPQIETGRLFAAGGIFVLALLGGFVLLVLFWVLRFTKKLVPVGFDLHPVRETASASAAVKTLIWLFVFMLIPGIAYGFAGVLDLKGTELLLVLAVATTFVTIITVVGLPRLPVFGESTTFTAMLGDRSDYWKNTLFGIGAAVANAPILVLVTLPMIFLESYLPTPTHPISDELASGVGIWQLLLLLYLAAVLAPLMEEVVFRGFIATGLKAQFNSFWFSLIVSSLLFAAIHPQGLMLIPALAAIGGMAAYVSHLRGSLLPAIVMHAVHNTTVLAIGLLVMSR